MTRDEQERALSEMREQLVSEVENACANLQYSRETGARHVWRDHERGVARLAIARVRALDALRRERDLLRAVVDVTNPDALLNALGYVSPDAGVALDALAAFDAERGGRG